jgi:hypothetical protein
MDTKQAKELIESYEFYHNGFDRLNGNSVIAINVRVNKTIIRADIKLVDFEENTVKRYNALEYPISVLESWEKVLKQDKRGVRNG